MANWMRIAWYSYEVWNVKHFARITLSDINSYCSRSAAANTQFKYEQYSFGRRIAHYLSPTRQQFRIILRQFHARALISLFIVCAMCVGSLWSHFSRSESCRPSEMCSMILSVRLGNGAVNKCCWAASLQLSAARIFFSSFFGCDLSAEIDETHKSANSQKCDGKKQCAHWLTPCVCVELVLRTHIWGKMNFYPFSMRPIISPLLCRVAGFAKNIHLFSQW